jgi:hypothetical protein
MLSANATEQRTKHPEVQTEQMEYKAAAVVVGARTSLSSKVVSKPSENASEGKESFHDMSARAQRLRACLERAKEYESNLDTKGHSQQIGVHGEK